MESMVIAMSALLSTTPAGGITQLLSYATEVFTWVMTQLGTLATFILSNPIILLSLVLTMVGFVVGFFRRVFNSV